MPSLPSLCEGQLFLPPSAVAVQSSYRAVSDHSTRPVWITVKITNGILSENRVHRNEPFLHHHLSSANQYATESHIFLTKHCWGQLSWLHPLKLHLRHNFNGAPCSLKCCFRGWLWIMVQYKLSEWSGSSSKVGHKWFRDSQSGCVHSEQVLTVSMVFPKMCGSAVYSIAGSQAVLLWQKSAVCIHHKMNPKLWLTLRYDRCRRVPQVLYLEISDDGIIHRRLCLIPLESE